MFAQAPCVSFDRPFSKGRGCGRRPRKRRFFFASFLVLPARQGEQMEILRRLNTADLQANCQNLLRLLPAKKKAAMKAEKPRGYSRLASANSLPAFSFDERCAKEKAIKKKTLVYGASPQTPRAFEKARQNFTTKVCANIVLNQNLFFIECFWMAKERRGTFFKRSPSSLACLIRQIRRLRQGSAP